MITQFQQAMATKPRAGSTAVMGHPGDDAFDPLIEQAEESQGILVTVMNTELPTAESTYASAGLGYVGAVLHEALEPPCRRGDGESEAGFPAGDAPSIWASKPSPGEQPRRPGCAAGSNLTGDCLEIDDATNKDPANGTAVFTGYASAHPDIRAGYVMDHGDLHLDHPPPT